MCNVTSGSMKPKREKRWAAGLRSISFYGSEMGTQDIISELARFAQDIRPQVCVRVSVTFHETGFSELVKT